MRLLATSCLILNTSGEYSGIHVTVIERLTGEPYSEITINEGFGHNMVARIAFDMGRVSKYTTHMNHSFGEDIDEYLDGFMSEDSS